MRSSIALWLLFGCNCAYLFPSCQNPVPCPKGLTQCSNAVCSDLRSDRANCGACFNVCASGMACRALADGGAGCGCPAEGSVVVGGACVDVLADPANCGLPGCTCDPIADCQSGVCVCPDGSLQCDAGHCCGSGVCAVPDGGSVLDAGLDAGDAGDGGPGDAGDAGDGG